MQNQYGRTEHGWVTFPFNGNEAVIQGIQDTPNGPQFTILSRVPTMAWSIGLNPNFQFASLLGGAVAGNAPSSYINLREAISRHIDVIEDACRFYAAVVANRKFPGSESYAS